MLMTYSDRARLRALRTVARFLWGQRPNNHGQLVALHRMLKIRRSA